MICATLDGTPCESAANVYICPGEDVYLWWQSSNDVASAEITPDVGSVAPSGNTIVRPTQTTDYTITVRNECERTADVHVHVVQAGDVIRIIANPVRDLARWQFDAPPALFSPSIRITAIEPVCAGGCFVHQPVILGYPYLSCGGGTTLCNGLWAGTKQDPDGTLTYFNTNISMPILLPGVPLAGTWQFVPIAPAWEYQGFAYFDLTATCV